ncbi:MAG: hypothetical protein VX278_23220 [Myxococcota bacterium]|nr:hypothetical protein [Myxococcota bacterium]
MVDTVSSSTVFDPFSGAYEGPNVDNLTLIGDGDDENDCSYPPPNYGCPEYSVEYSGTAWISVGGYGDNCNSSGTGQYRLRLDGAGADTATLYTGNTNSSNFSWVNTGTYTTTITVGCCHHVEYQSKTCDSSTLGDTVKIGGPTNVTPNTGTATLLQSGQGMSAELYSNNTEIEWSGATGCGCDTDASYSVEIYQCQN